MYINHYLYQQLYRHHQHNQNNLDTVTEMYEASATYVGGERFGNPDDDDDTDDDKDTDTGFFFVD